MTYSTELILLDQEIQKRIPKVLEKFEHLKVLIMIILDGVGCGVNFNRNEIMKHISIL